VQRAHQPLPLDAEDLDAHGTDPDRPLGRGADVGEDVERDVDHLVQDPHLTDPRPAHRDANALQRRALVAEDVAVHQRGQVVPGHPDLGGRQVEHERVGVVEDDRAAALAPHLPPQPPDPEDDALADVEVDVVHLDGGGGIRRRTFAVHRPDGVHGARGLGVRGLGSGLAVERDDEERRRRRDQCDRGRPDAGGVAHVSDAPPRRAGYARRVGSRSRAGVYAWLR
jgi:hypothetical protein